MRKVIIFSLSLISLVAMSGCRKSKLDPAPVERTGRMGPGYKWELSTTNQENTSEYYINTTSPSKNRVYYLKGSTGYTRSVTLTVTKTNSDALVPSFRVYTGQEQCVSISSPKVSLGDIAPLTFQRESLQGPMYTGYFWSIPFAFSPVNTKVTFTFNLSAPSSSCSGGYIAVDMASPARINSASNYWDLDYLSVVKSTSK